MLTIGLLGGVASGKSAVARLLAEHGAAVLDADRAAHEALASDEVIAALRQKWGEGLFAADGVLVRKKLAQRIFGPGEQRAADRRFLEGLVHPRVRAALRTELQGHRAAGTAVVVLDIPLLLEAGWADECDLVLLVDSTQEARLARAAERGWDAQELAWREAAQAPMSEKRRRADFVIANSSSLDDLRLATHRFWDQEVTPRAAAAE